MRRFLVVFFKITFAARWALADQSSFAAFLAQPPTTVTATADAFPYHMSDLAASSSRPDAQSRPRLVGPIVQPPRPNDCTYWVTDSLLAGEYPTDARGEEETRTKIQGYLDQGVTFFLDLTERGEKGDYDAIVVEEAAKRGMGDVAIRHRRLQVPDFGVPNVEKMKSILNTIDRAIELGHKVYVHCRGGIGRTGTTVGCYFVRNGNGGQEALDEVNRLFKCSDRSKQSSRSPETAEQEDFIRSWNVGS